MPVGRVDTDAPVGARCEHPVTPGCVGDDGHTAAGRENPAQPVRDQGLPEYFLGLRPRSHAGARERVGERTVRMA